MSITNSLRARFDAMFGRELADIQARHDAEVTEVREKHRRELQERDAEIARLKAEAADIEREGTKGFQLLVDRIKELESALHRKQRSPVVMVGDDGGDVSYEQSGGGWL